MEGHLDDRATGSLIRRLFLVLIPAILVLPGLFPAPSSALPAFARKYGTSCLTCHTIYPKLNSFGEAFRRNGFRFPGIDSDFVKQETIPMGQEAQKKEFPNAVWPATVPGSVPLAAGFNGHAVTHPDRKAGGTAADNGARFILKDLVEEGHLWAGMSFDDQISFFGELTVTPDGASLELAHLHVNDVVGPKHALNLVAGKMLPTLSSFGPRSSYLVDLGVTPISVTGLYGATSESWNVGGAYSGVEANGSLRGRFGWALGTNAGANADTRDAQNIYAHAEYKLGGMRLDGEDSSGVANPQRPWAETAITLEGFYYHAVSHFEASDGAIRKDRSPAAGGGIRAQWESLELDAAAYTERHDDPRAGGGKVDAIASYEELSYVLYPWLVPAVRVEYLRLKPAGEDAVTDLRVLVGADALIRPNLKVSIVGQIERATGAPNAGWSAASGMAIPMSATDKVGPELEAITVGLAYAF
jgi:hypothetical protein